MTSYTFRKSIYRDILSTEIREKYMTTYTRYIRPYDRAWDMATYTEYMWSYDGICHVVRIPDALSKGGNILSVRRADISKLGTT